MSYRDKKWVKTAEVLWGTTGPVVDKMPRTKRDVSGAFVRHRHVKIILLSL